jgi:hypothetical protein
MTGAMGFGQVKSDAIGDEHIEYTPQQMGTPPSGDRVEDDDHMTPEATGASHRAKPNSCHDQMSFP